MMRVQEPMDDAVERIELAPGFTVSRISVGLRQASAGKHDREASEPELTSAALAEYLDAGFTTFAMAAQNGSAEVISSRIDRGT